MAVAIATIGLVYIDPTGNVVDKQNATIKQVMNASHEPRVLPNSYNTNSDDHPTIEDYITREDSDGRKLAHLDQYKVITQD